MIDPGENGAFGAIPAKLPFDCAVVLSPFSWNFRDDMMQTTHYVTQELARRCPTVLIEPPVQWNPRGEQFRLHRLPQAVFGRRTRSPQPHLLIFHRRGLPFGRHALPRKFDLARNAKALRRLLQELGFDRALLWHSFPYWSESLVEAVDHRLFAYHCLDHSSREEEERLVRRADAVFCVTKGLVERHLCTNPETHLLPNGVDLNLFNPENARKSLRPADLPKNGRLIGFVGSINCHLDIGLLLSIATAFPRDHLVLVGRVLTNETAPRGRQLEALTKLSSLSNVEILGFRPPTQLPAYMHAFDVCVIPFLANEFNQERDPLKFYQYFALGKPVVTTPVPVAERYGDLCYMATSEEEFVHSVLLALGEQDRDARSQARLQVARSHSWQSLLSQACRTLSALHTSAA